MKCPRCSLTFSCQRDQCPRCGLDVESRKQSLGIRPPRRSNLTPDQQMLKEARKARTKTRSRSTISSETTVSMTVEELAAQQAALTRTRSKKLAQREEAAKRDVTDLLDGLKDIRSSKPAHSSGGYPAVTESAILSQAFGSGTRKATGNNEVEFDLIAECTEPHLVNNGVKVGSSGENSTATELKEPPTAIRNLFDQIKTPDSSDIEATFHDLKSAWDLEDGEDVDASGQKPAVDDAPLQVDFTDLVEDTPLEIEFSELVVDSNSEVDARREDELGKNIEDQYIELPSAHNHLQAKADTPLSNPTAQSSSKKPAVTAESSIPGGKSLEELAAMQFGDTSDHSTSPNAKSQSAIGTTFLKDLTETFKEIESKTSDPTILGPEIESKN